jgi:DNA repair protein RecN (Recombination protein N)
MRELGIKGGALALAFTTVENESGFDGVEYQVVTNPRFPAGPLAQIASGGERSRISLAIQVVAAERAKLPALILDEADVGIGGVTADVVGRLLRNLAEHTQVLCVTHAPQVAACGDHHLRIGKTMQGETFIERLDADARVQELARMLGGREITPKTIEYATELIEAGAARVLR